MGWCLMGSVVIDAPAPGSVGCYSEIVFSGRELPSPQYVPFLHSGTVCAGVQKPLYRALPAPILPMGSAKASVASVSVELLLVLRPISLTVLEALFLRANPSK